MRAAVFLKVCGQWTNRPVLPNADKSSRTADRCESSSRCTLSRGQLMRRIIGTAAALLLVAAPALAQSAPRQGFTVSFGGGAGSAGFSYEGSTSDRISGPSGYLRLGGAVSPSLVIAGETHGWTHSEGGV